MLISKVCISTTAHIGSLTSFEYLLVGGGGSGGGAQVGGGGGGGGVVAGNWDQVALGTQYTITVGAGGSWTNGDGNIGTKSTIASSAGLTVTAWPGTGGKGSMRDYSSVPDSASGGGGTGNYRYNYGGNYNTGFTAGTHGQGTSGGSAALGAAGVVNASQNGGAGGGGAGQGGGSVHYTSKPAGNGGDGLPSSISGQIQYFGGGGGGGPGLSGYGPDGNSLIFVNSQGGLGGGGIGTGYGDATRYGVTNTGGGGGGTYNYFYVGAGGGGSGIAIIKHSNRFPAASTTGSPTITVVAGYRIYTFTGSGTITFY